MSTLVIAPASYAKFELPDATPNSIVTTWMHVWPSDLEPRRANVADFDRTTVGDDGVQRAETYVGVR